MSESGKWIECTEQGCHCRADCRRRKCSEYHHADESREHGQSHKYDECPNLLFPTQWFKAILSPHQVFHGYRTEDHADAGHHEYFNEIQWNIPECPKGVDINQSMVIIYEFGISFMMFGISYSLC